MITEPTTPTLNAADAVAALAPGDVVQVVDRQSGYSGCVLDYLSVERGWIVCRNDSYPKFYAPFNGRPVGAIRVRGVRFMRKGVSA